MNDEQKNYPFDAIDLVFMLLAPSHPALIALCIVQYVARRVITKQRIDAFLQPLRTIRTIKHEVATQLATVGKLDNQALQNAVTLATLPTPPDSDLLALLFERLHLLIIGHTRGGKTTLIHELAVRWSEAGHTVLVCDPDAAPGLWNKCYVVGAGDDYDAIEIGLTKVAGLIAKRRSLRASGVRSFKPLYVIMDEVQDIMREVDSTRQLVEDIARRGGKLNIHLILGVQDKLVKTLKLEGQSALRTNFTVVEVRYEQGQRVATITEHDNGVMYHLPVPPLPNIEQLITSIPHVDTDEMLIFGDLKTSNNNGSGTSSNHSSNGTKQAGDTSCLFNDDNSVTAFLDQCVDEKEGSTIQAEDLYKLYRTWCEQRHTQPETITKFGLVMKQEDYIKTRTAQGRVQYQDIALKGSK